MVATLDFGGRPGPNNLLREKNRPMEPTQEDMVYSGVVSYDRSLVSLHKFPGTNVSGIVS